MRKIAITLLILATIALAGCGTQETAEDLASEACERLQAQGGEADLEPIDERRQEADIFLSDYQRAVEEQCPEVAPFGPAADDEAP